MWQWDVKQATSSHIQFILKKIKTQRQIKKILIILDNF